MSELERLQEENKALRKELEGVRYCATWDKSELDYVKKECEGLWDTFLALGDKLGIDTEEARSASGKPSDVFLKYIQKRDLLMKAEALRDYADNLQGADKKFTLEAAEYYQDKSEED